MSRLRSSRTLVLAFATSGFMASCRGSDPSAATQPASLSGTVKTETGAVIEGALVTIGSPSTTTSADGRFELHNLQAGNARMTTSAPRFDEHSRNIVLNPGPNNHDVVLTPRTIYTHQGILAYLRPGVAKYRAAIVFLPGLRDPVTGNPLDSRPLVHGTAELACSIWCLPNERTSVRTRALELAGGNVALVGTTTLVDNPGSYDALLQALDAFAAQSQHPELADIPILFVGHSMGGCTAYGFSRVHGARVAGFLTMKGACHVIGPAGAAASVPGYFLIGGMDEPFRRDNITAVFEAGRAGGAPWAISIDDFDHRPIMDFELMFNWIDTILTARLPAVAGAPLRPVRDADGWLGNRSNGAISTYACYSADRSSASWLPSEEAALNWQRMAKGALVTRAC
jgi:pimeloyl-ACP methyl ester carboxylesterase